MTAAACVDLPEEVSAPVQLQGGSFVIRLLGADEPRDIVDVDPVARMRARVQRALGTDRFHLRALALPRTYALDIVEGSPGLDARTLRRRLEAAASPGAADEIAYVEPDYEYALEGTPDPYFEPTKQWGLQHVDAPQAWANMPAQGAAVTVGVIDGGIYFEPVNATRTAGSTVKLGDFDPARLVAASCLAPSEVGVGLDVRMQPFGCKPFDDKGHGTQVASILGAATHNGVGIAGALGTSNIRMLLIGAFNAEGKSQSSLVVDAIVKAGALGARVLNLSFGGPDPSRSVCEALAAFGALGGVAVAAAGNAGTNNDQERVYPASYALPNVISVMGTNRQDQTEHSNYGSNSVHLAAPGVDIFAATRNLQYFAPVSGTSFATPFVAATAALLKSANPLWSPAKIRTHIIETVDKVSDLQNVARGRLDMARALASPIVFSPNGVVGVVSASHTVRVNWKRALQTSACTTMYVHLLLAGPNQVVPGTCAVGSSCRVLASGIAVSSPSGGVNVQIPANTAGKTGRIRIGCEASTFSAVLGPYAL